jgi:hypothetical protein
LSALTIDIYPNDPVLLNVKLEIIAEVGTPGTNDVSHHDWPCHIGIDGVLPFALDYVHHASFGLYIENSPFTEAETLLYRPAASPNDLLKGLTEGDLTSTNDFLSSLCV